MAPTPHSPRPDVLILGGGLIGRACAATLADRGARVLLLEHVSAGEASSASAGMLAPSVERAEGAAHELAIAARDRYPSFLEWLRERSGVTVPLNRDGVLQVALSPAGVKGVKKTAAPGAQWLDQSELAKLEPALAHALGALHSPHDGCVDSVALLRALDAALAASPLVRRMNARVVGVRASADGAIVTDDRGRRHEGRYAVVAAGAWSPRIAGARFARAVEPVRGQLVSYGSAPIRHTMYGPRGYLVPRGDATIAGSTMERVGFDAATTEEGIARVRSAGEEICPVLSHSPPTAAWAGLRPVTPDLLPLVGPDPEQRRLIYATGHSRNGVLLGPLTADIVAAVIFEDVLNLPVERYRPDRF